MNENQPGNRGYWQPQDNNVPSTTEQPPGATQPAPPPDSALVSEQPSETPSTPLHADLGGAALYSASPAAAESHYAGYELSNEEMVPQPLHENVSWEASEYIHHSKSFLWFAVFGLVVAGLVAIAIWLRIWTFAVLILVMAAAMIFYALRPPRILHYSLTPEGLVIDDKHYGYDDFRAFGVMSDGALFSVVLIPVKRFMPAVNIYFEESDGEKIVDILGGYLPMEKVEQDFMDKLMRHLRF